MEVEGLMWILESWKNQFEFWKSPGNLFLKKGTNPVHSTVFYLFTCYLLPVEGILFKICSLLPQHKNQ